MTDNVQYKGAPLATERFNDDADPDAMVKHIAGVLERCFGVDEQTARAGAESWIRTLESLPVDSIVIEPRAGKLVVTHCERGNDDTIS